MAYDNEFITITLLIAACSFADFTSEEDFLELLPFSTSYNKIMRNLFMIMQTHSTCAWKCIVMYRVGMQFFCIKVYKCKYIISASQITNIGGSACTELFGFLRIMWK